ncbi:MAG TPA: AraC family transcriptional regulator [Pyrinomonadaceae bacterium]|nr:AraC family transcriptional regulator [Pyrinomonadaceae bacterium]
MNSALSNQTFYNLNRGKHLSEIFTLPKDVASVYVSTHFELGRSDLLHYHDEPHLTFILNGGVIDKRKTFENEQFGGELMFFRAGEPHQTISKIFPTKYISLQFQTDFFKQNSHIESALEAAIEKNFDAKISMLKIYRELAINDEFSETSMEMLMQNLIESPAKGKTCPNWLKKIVELLNDRWNDEISLNDLALAANVHPKTISKYFPRFFKCTLGEYRRKIKIEKSFTMIKSSKFSLTDIAYQCDFYDQSHFTKTFKDLTGFLPKEFQKL